ncbi:MAG: hypothetical protein M5R36_24690 [Deltaproteobacteria bacterium]|nr:hypothetical protein [Deltaproteobacteria bacterium]
MSDAQNQTYPAEDASILFSGGTDSTLAAYLVSKIARRVHLLTFDNGFIFFVDNSRRHADKLRTVLGDDRVVHKIIPIQDPIRKVLLGDVKHDLGKYGFNLTALVCLGCRMSMHTAALIHNLENRIPIVADGSIAKQAAIPEQLESFIRRNRRELWERYGVRHYSPIYREDHSDVRLDELGISGKRKLKKAVHPLRHAADLRRGGPGRRLRAPVLRRSRGAGARGGHLRVQLRALPDDRAFRGRALRTNRGPLPGVVDEMREKTASLPERWEDLPHG